MKKLLREPLIHFLLIGAGLFLVYGLLNASEGSDPEQKIVVSKGRIQQLSNIFNKTWQRPPTKDELQGLIDDFVLEEVYYRQAVEMGLDRDDTIIRRRLRQKLEFLTADTSSLVQPTEEELEKYLRENEDMFREPGTYTFRQVYFNPEKHGEVPETYIPEQLTALRAGETEIGDVSLLPTSIGQATRQAVDGTFGPGFSGELDKLKAGDWQGPVRSGFGFHLIRIDSVTKGRLSELSEIRQIVHREWSNAKRLSVRNEINASMLDDHDVVIEWPEESATKAAAREGDAP